jgi:hypothetical protein
MRLVRRIGTALLLAALAGGCDSDVVPLVFGADAVTAGDGSCRSVPLPRFCFRDPIQDLVSAACIFGPDGVAVRNVGGGASGGPPPPGAVQILGNGCVGGLIVLDGALYPAIDAPDAARASSAPVHVRGTPCCAEIVPGSQIPHLVTFDPSSRALIVRTAEPIQGPTQLALFGSFAALFGGTPYTQGGYSSGYVWRFYVGGTPPVQTGAIALTTSE